VTNLLVGDDISWSDNLIHALPQVSSKYILLFIDDLLLVETVKTEPLIKTLKDFMERDGNYLRLNPNPKPDRPLTETIGIVSRGTIYRTATVSSVWKKQTLLELLVPGETAWELEVFGSMRSDECDGFYSTYRRVFSVVNAVIKGKWERGALSRLRAIGVTPQLGNRPLMTWKESLHLKCWVIRNHGLHLLPARFRRRAKDFFVGKKNRYRAVASL